ncbi:hypothetical protein B0H12DRAFT_145121 [Mycena haematopus]|nr:hypothetical protein B0H12DRAFT_145121 [Mycena haematopus]
MSYTDLYSRLLFAARHGYPLPHPQPSDDSPRRAGLEIGDVGAVTSDDFEAVPLESGSYISSPTHFKPGSHVSNSQTRTQHVGSNVEVHSNPLIPVKAGAVVEISTSAERTAVLILQGGASRIDLRFLRTFKKQAEKHGENWYAFVENLGYPLENGDLYLVTGVDKSALWNVSATEKQTGADHIYVKVRAVQNGPVGGSYRWEWENGIRFSDSGPRRPAEEVPDFQNQTVFFRGFKIRLSDTLFEKQKKTKAAPIAGSRPSDILPREGFFSPASRWIHKSPGVLTVYTGDKETTSVSYIPASYKQYHPADVINEHLLALSSDISVAVIHDDEWMSVLKKEEEEVPEDDELIRRIFLKYSVEVDSGCASLAPRAEGTPPPKLIDDSFKDERHQNPFHMPGAKRVPSERCQSFGLDVFSLILRLPQLE